MSEHSEEELLFHTLIVPLVLLMQLLSFILIPSPAVWGVKWIPGMLRLTIAALFSALKTKRSIGTGCSPFSAHLPKLSTHFCWCCAGQAISFLRWACHSRERSWRAELPDQVPSASSLSSLLLAALMGLAALIQLRHLPQRPLLHMEISWHLCVVQVPWTYKVNWWKENLNSKLHLWTVLPKSRCIGLHINTEKFQDFHAKWEFCRKCF